MGGSVEVIKIAPQSTKPLLLSSCSHLIDTLRLNRVEDYGCIRHALQLTYVHHWGTLATNPSADFGQAVPCAQWPCQWLTTILRDEHRASSSRNITKELSDSGKLINWRSRLLRYASSSRAPFAKSPSHVVRHDAAWVME